VRRPRSTGPNPHEGDRCRGVRGSRGRNELYLALHPETGHGKAPGKKGGKKDSKGARAASFADDTNDRTGRSRPSIARDVAQREPLG